MFATKYLAKKTNNALIEGNPDEHTGIIVVIPCLREPNILHTLESLKACTLPTTLKVEVIVLINHPESTSEEIRALNANTKEELDSWISKHQSKGIAFYAVGPIELQKKWAGAGLARKLGMDEAIRRFNAIEKPQGILVSLDADTLVQPNYFITIEDYFCKHPKHIALTIAVEHQKQGLVKRQLEGINLYERYLLYYKEALSFSGYPYSMFTIGSAFAVKALAYVKRGGMNRRQAGEDFYFLQNLAQIGTIGELTATTVFPSARLSNRVPFGTGPILQKWMNGEKDLTKTFDFSAFIDLKKFFNSKDIFFNCSKEKFNTAVRELPISVSTFVTIDNFWNEVKDLNENCSSLASFKLRFFHRFNALKILKYLNYAHSKFYKELNLEDQIKRLEENK